MAQGCRNPAMAAAVASVAQAPACGAGVAAGAGAPGCGPRQLVLKHSERQWKQRGDGAWAVHNVVDDGAVQAEVEAQAGTTSAREDAVAGGTAKVKVHVMSTGRVIECVVGAGDTRPLRCLTCKRWPWVNVHVNQGRGEVWRQGDCSESESVQGSWCVLSHPRHAFPVDTRH